MKAEQGLSGQMVYPRSSWKGVTAFCTTRFGGVSQAPYESLNLGLGSGDDSEQVLANRRLLSASLPSEPQWLKQVHGARVELVDFRQPLDSCLVPEADASVTTQSGCVLAILTADCLPVVLADSQGTVLGVAHAGWRGLAAGVLEGTLEAMVASQPQAQDFRAWLGPAIGPSAFQVGADVLEAFVSVDPQADRYFRLDPDQANKWLADLPGLAEYRLRKWGLTHVENAGLCTVTDPQRRFFSYRRDKQTGRMATLAWLQHE